MANRDMRRTIEATRYKVSAGYDMSVSDLVELGDLAKDKPLEAVSDAFLYGYSLGQRALRAKMKSPTCEGAQAGQATNQAQ